MKLHSGKFDFFLEGKLKHNGSTSGENFLILQRKVYDGRFSEFLPFGNLAIEIKDEMIDGYWVRGKIVGR